MPRLELDDGAIVRLYVEDGLRGATIARIMGCSDAVISARLTEAGVHVSSSARLDRDDVTRLHRDEAWTCSALGERCGVAHQTISRHLRNWGVPLRSRLEAQQPAGRRPCPASPVIRAYLLGFATGDLWINRPNHLGQTILATCNTTHREQVQLIEDVFSPYGPVRQSGQTVSASLGPSFDFLFEKYERRVPRWISGPAPMTAYAGGYIDAEVRSASTKGEPGSSSTPTTTTS